MNLKTHIGYSEIIVNEDFSYVARVISLDGKVFEELTGTGESRQNAIKLASIAVATMSGKYERIPEESDSEEMVITADDVGVINSGGGQ